jgi:hypothetical protein
MRISLLRATAASTLAFSIIAINGCRSYRVQVSVENRTGAAVQLLEVDYPSASFGADALAAGASMHYSLQVRGSGPVKVQYTAGNAQAQVTGPTLTEKDQGQLAIVLLPGGKAEFTPQLSHSK